ncbi:MAG TPA: hypothetical protein VGW38_20500, partial [Chloroflexota bacterium]|nr:hypothetical protein [Chloroflexota bacterium]
WNMTGPSRGRWYAKTAITGGHQHERVLPTRPVAEGCNCARVCRQRSTPFGSAGGSGIGSRG